MAYTKPSANTKTRHYGLEYYSLASFEKFPAYLGTRYNKYGKGFGFYDFLRMANNQVDILMSDGGSGLTRDEVTAFEKGAYWQPVRVDSSGISTSTTAGDSITFKINSTEYDSDNNTFLRVGDTITIPPKYLSEDIPAAYRVSAVGATSSANCTAYPLRSTAQITTAVPANAYLQVGFNPHGRGTGQPSARSTYGYSRTFYTTILKETMHITGGMVAQETYIEKLKNGGQGLFFESQFEAEDSLDRQIDNAIWISDYNDNSVTETDENNDSVSVRTTDGFWVHLDSLGQSLPYVTRFSITDFDTAKELFRSQGVIDTEVAFLVGPKLVTQLDNMGLDFIKEYSGGTDFTKTANELGVNFNAFIKNGMKYIAKELISFSDATSWAAGNLEDYFSNAGVMIPMTQASVMDTGKFFSPEGGKVTLPNVCIGYLNNNDEDRGRVFKVSAGVNGLNYPAVNQYDSVKGYLLSEFALIAMQVNQMIKVTKSGTY